MNKHIPLYKVHMPKKGVLMQELKKVLYSGMVTEGEYVKKFEEALQNKFQLASRPLSTNSCTSALQLAHRVCNVKEKFVLSTPMTCTATNMPIFAEGGIIVWCDIDPSTGNISVQDVESKIQKLGPDRIAAISFVDFAGFPADIKSLVSVSKKYNIPLIEDAAQSLGAKWNNQFIGLHCEYVAYSFQAIKHLTTIDGGALINNTNTWELTKKLKWYGINREAVKEATRWHYDVPEWGYKFHMNNVAATIGIAQLLSIDEVISSYKKNGQWFNKHLANIPGLELLKISSQSDPSYWVYMIKVENRDGFAKKMLDAKIDVNVSHIRNDKYSCFLNNKNVLNPLEERPGLEEFNNKYIAIPCGWWLSSKDRIHIKNTIKNGW